MKKTLKHFEKIILELNKEGKSSYHIQKTLHRDYNFKTYSSNVRTFLRKRGLGKYTTDTFEKSLEKNNFQAPDNWSYGWLKGKEASVFVKNTNGLIPYDEMRKEFKEEMSKYSPKYPKIDRKPVKDNHLLVVDIADLHVGKHTFYNW